MSHSFFYSRWFRIFIIAAALLTISNFSAALAAPIPPPSQTRAALRPNAGAIDCNIQWNEVLHDSFSGDYRSPGGATTPTNTVKLRLRVAQGDINSARVRIWDDRANAETFYNMAWDGMFDTDPTTYDWWYADIPVGAQPTILYYYFELNDDPDNNPNNGICDQDFYADDDPKFYGGGYGRMYDDNYPTNGQTGRQQAEANGFQITVYNAAFSVPSWMQQGIVYQIFPDRFRDGNSSNDPAAGRFFYNEAGGTIVRSNDAQGDWNTKICDPRNLVAPTCNGAYSNNFYGGDLQGITDKINQGFFDNLGVSVIYLNPIFRSPSNHKYDTADYLTIDPDFGTLADFQTLATAAHNHNIKLILDGVFNHTSSDSTYFDRYFRYNSSGALTSPNGIGTDDNSGGCEANASPYYAWFYFPDIGNAGKDGNTTVYCSNDAPQTYEAWYGYSSLPKLKANSAAVRNLIWNNGTNSVGPYWTQQGADGWRFDVGADVDPGLTNDPTNDYWEGFRGAVRNVKSDTLTLGEEWGDASAWLLGNEWDSVMNYRFRSAVLNWLFTGCAAGDGCNGGTEFSENDSNSGSASGAIAYISPSQFNARLRSIQEDYPPMAWKAMMNLPGSHDTQRVRFLLKKINNDNDSAAVQRMKEWWLFAFTYAGAPTLYYGDEVGLSQDGVDASGTYQDDPYNRVPYPWDDTPGDLTADTSNLLVFQRKMASIRLMYPALQDGDVQHGIVLDDANKLYGFARTNGAQTALIVLNRDGSAHNATLTGLNVAPYNIADGANVLYDAIEGNAYSVSSGSVTVPVNSTWGVVLLEKDKIQTPVAPQNVMVTSSGGSNYLQWSASVTDTSGQRELANTYTIHRAQTPGFTPNGSNLIATVAPSAFGTANGKVMYTDASPPPSAETTHATNYYAVCALNAGGNSNCSSAQAPTGIPSCPLLTSPVLQTPENKSLSQKRRVTLSWSESFCEANYKVQVRANSRKGERVMVAKNLDATQIKTKRLARGTTYFWRVTSCAAGDCMRSGWHSFTVR